jgi:signal transduction histidine kinase
MRRWLRPTLTRRVILALILAFAGVWAALLTLNYLTFKQQMRSNSGLHQLSGALSAALADVDDTARAQNVLATTAVWINIMRRDGGQLPGEVLFQLWDRAGHRLYSAPALGGQALAGVPAQVQDQTINGLPYWVIQRDTARWSLRVAEPRLGDGSVLESIGGELLTYLLLAFPLVLLPLWLAVRRGLRPLHQLTQRIAARAPDDLSPIGHDLKYVELQPLVAAFENMLVQLRGKVRRERAFVQDAAHELRTPMAVITAQAHVIARSVDADLRQQAQVHLNEAIARASHVAGQLLELATLDETHPRELSSFDVAHHLRHLLAQKVAHAIERNIDLSLDAPDTLHWPLDLAAFQSVIHNLLDNALRYVHEGCRITVAAGTAGGTLMLSVADDGPGIAEELRELVFERFYRVNGNTAPGSGLGLAIVRQAVRRMGGTVRIAPGLDQRGCTFHVQLGAA